MPPWAQGQQYSQQLYGGYNAFAGGFPNVTASGSPMNYGAYYPPGSGYGAQYNRGYPGASSYTPTGGSTYGQQASPGASNIKSGGSSAQPSAAQNNSESTLTGMQNLSLASK